MISLSCHHRGKSLKLKDELAGKKIRCPQCKQVLGVPVPLSEDVTVPPSNAHPVKEDGTLAPSWSSPPDDAPVRGTAVPPTNGSTEKTEEDLDAAAHYKVV